MHKRISRSFLFLLLACIAMGGSVASAQSGLKVGVFDSQRVSQETAEGQRLQTEFNQLREAKQAQISALEEEAAGLRQQLDQQALSLSAERRTALEMQIQRKILELQNTNDLATQELQLELNNAMSKFNEALLVGVEQFGREEGFDLLLDTSLVAWASDSIDVTTAIIDRLNELFPEAEE